MKEIGGYFELELNPGKEYHSNAIKLNLGRTALEYVLRAKKVQKIFLPYYTCDVILESIKRSGINYEFYYIDENLEPIYNYTSLNSNDYFLYTNYFGVKEDFIIQMAKRVKNLIVDNAQAFYSRPLANVDTFYSPRKFFGVPDGGYLYTDKTLYEDFEFDNSSDRFVHLIGRIEKCAEEYYQFFKDNDQKLCDQPIKKMSKITRRLLQNINYKWIADIRWKNFQYLHKNLADNNLLKFTLTDNCVPMVYPFYVKKGNLKQQLIGKRIFVATYWPNVLNWCITGDLEFNLAKYLVSIPIDQRYGESDMNKIIEALKSDL